MPTSDPVLRARSRLGLASRARDTQAISAARRDLAVALAERAICKALPEAPLPEQREHLVALILGGAK